MKYKSLIVENIKATINSYIFKYLLITSLIINIVYTLNILFNNLSFNYLESLYYISTNAFYILFFLALILINTINTLHIFNKNTFYIIRFHSKKEYYNSLIKNVFLVNSIFYFINMILLITMCNLIFGSTFVITNWQQYNVINIVYIIFHFVKCLIIIEIITTLFPIIYKAYGRIGMIVYLLFIGIPLLLSSYKVEIINDIWKMSLFPVNYLSGGNYSSFSLELFSTLIYIIILLIFYCISFEIIKRKVKGVIE